MKPALKKLPPPVMPDAPEFTPRRRDFRIRCTSCGATRRILLDALIQRRQMSDVMDRVPATTMDHCGNCNPAVRVLSVHFVDLVVQEAR